MRTFARQFSRWALGQSLIVSVFHKDLYTIVLTPAGPKPLMDACADLVGPLFVGSSQQPVAPR